MFWRWLTGRKQTSPLPPHCVVMYTRRGCHLCESAWDLLRAYQQTHGFTLTAVDVDGDPALVALHGDSVPVVEVDGVVRFRGVVNPVLLRRLFRGT